MPEFSIDSIEFDLTRLTIGDYLILLNESQTPNAFPLFCIPLMVKVSGQPLTDIPLEHMWKLMDKFAEAIKCEVDSPDGLFHWKGDK